MRCFLMLLSLFSVCLLLSGCDALEESEEKQGGVINPQVIDHQGGRVTPPPRDLIREMLLSAPEGEWPEPLPVLTWFENLDEGWREVESEGRPMLVLVRCPVSNASGSLDQELLSPPPGLAEILRQFVTVVITDGQRVDLNRLPMNSHQDPDQTWWLWILSPQGQVYSVLGEKNRGTVSLSTDDLVAWMTEVLNHHWDPRRLDWKADGEPVDPTTPPLSITENPAYEMWKAGAEHMGTLRKEQQCMCCHQVQDTFWSEIKLTTQFLPHIHYVIWPPEENVGFILQDDHRIALQEVMPDSFASKTSLQAQDRIGVITNKRVFSGTDLRVQLHTYEGRSGRTIYAVRGGDYLDTSLSLQTGNWRRYDLSWRKSIYESVISSHPGFIPQEVNEGTKSKLGLSGKLALKPLVGKASPAWAAGIRPDQIIYEYVEDTTEMTPYQFLFNFKMTAPVGAKRFLSVGPADGKGPGRKVNIPALSIFDVPQEAFSMFEEK
ncbi:MAG: hypothetical protein HUJ26_03520 [Planctomycetaceae bacterium]|nr:hypothetical protein [Planctomycetaceae bacterium]